MVTRKVKSKNTPAGGVRDRILEAAVTVLQEEGIAALTQVRVAAAAGVRQSHLTYYFPKRADLVEAVLAGVVDGMVCAVGHGLGAEAGAPRLALERLSHEIAEREHMRMFIGSIVAADGDPELHSILVAATRRMEARVAEALALEPEHARVVLVSLWGMGLYSFVLRDSGDADPGVLLPAWLSAAAALLPAWLSPASGGAGGRRTRD